MSSRLFFHPLHIILFFSLLPGAFVSAQSAVIGTSTSNESSISICADNSGNSFIGGTRDNKALVIRQDIGHAITWSRELTFSSNTSLIPEIGFIDVIGDTVFGCGFLRNNTTVAGGIYFKINALTGAPYWIKTVTSPTLSAYVSMRYSNGLFMLVGGTYNVLSAPFNDGFVTGVSSQTGAMIWQTPAIGIGFPGFNDNYIDDFYSATKIVNGQLFITGRSYVGNSTLNMRSLLIGVDTGGNVFLSRYLLNNTSLGGADNRYYGQAIEFDGTDSLVIGFMGDDACTGCNDFKTGLIKCDLLGNVGFVRYYDIPGVTQEIVRMINVTPTGYVLLGHVDTGMSSQKAFVLKTTKQGHIVDGITIAPSSGTYTIYSGIGNVGAGNGCYKNGLHYFAVTQINGTDKNIRKLVLNDNLEDVMSCGNLQHLTVGEISLTPFSGPLNVLPIPVSLTFTNGSSASVSIQDACEGASVSVSQSTLCSSVTVTATANGLSSPVYSWSNGSSSATTIVSTADTLFLTVTSAFNCCILYDTLVPVPAPATPITVALSADTTLCPGSSYTVVPVVQNPNGAVSYTWSTGSSAQTIAVSSSASYWVQVTDNCSSDSDTIQVTMLPAVSLAHAPLVEVCANDFPITLVPTIVNADYQEWTGGSTDPALTVYEPGIYWLTGGNDCGEDSISITVVESILPTATPVFIDTCVNTGTPVTLSPVYANVDDILWSTGSEEEEIQVTESGIYTLIVTNTCGIATVDCEAIIQTYPELDLPSTLDTCLTDEPGFYYTVSGTPGTYSWSTGSNTATEWVTDGGVYICTLTNSCGTVSAEMTVNFSVAPFLWISEDTASFCSTALPVQQLGIETDYDLSFTDEWGITAGQVITESGWYIVTAYNTCSSASDSVYIDLKEPLFYLPNTFTPNGDEHNQLYVWKGEHTIVTKILIVNRWGEIVYEASGEFTGWDGTYKGAPCPDGIYQVIITYNDCFGIPTLSKSHVSLLR